MDITYRPAKPEDLEEAERVVQQSGSALHVRTWQTALAGATSDRLSGILSGARSRRALGRGSDTTLRQARNAGERHRPGASFEDPDASREQRRRQSCAAIVGRWFEGFCGNPWNPEIIDELAAPDMLLQYSLHAPRRGREDVRNFMEGFRAAFPDLNFWGAADLIAEGDYVLGRWEGGGTHTGPAFSDFLIGSLPAASGRKMRFTGTTILRVENGKIAEEVGLDDGVTALQQLGLLKAA
jgi:predicted ester cyclase